MDYLKDLFYDKNDCFYHRLKPAFSRHYYSICIHRLKRGYVAFIASEGIISENFCVTHLTGRDTICSVFNRIVPFVSMCNQVK